MRKLIFVLLALFLLAGCELTIPESTKETAPYYAGHTDHVAPVARRKSGFFVDTVSSELTTHYLAYKEPDGCVTHVIAFDSREDAPNLFCVEKTFYYMEGNSDGEEGILRSVTFDGEKAHCTVEGMALNYIIRTDDSYVYCAANMAETYVKVSLDMSQWEQITREEAIG